MRHIRRVVARPARSCAVRASQRTPAFVLAALAAVLFAGAANLADAQCAFQHPKKAARLRTSLVQAFVPCECHDECMPIPVPPYVICDTVCGNTTSEGGLAACAPPETFSDLGGYTDGWRWNPSSSSGEFELKARTGCAAVAHGTSTPPCDPASPLNPPGTADLAVRLKLRGVETLSGPVTGTGNLAIILDITLADPMNGDMSMVWMPVNFSVDVVDGSASVETSIDAALNQMGTGGLPGLPACTSVHVVSVLVYDENGSQFAHMGVLLPPQ